MNEDSTENYVLNIDVIEKAIINSKDPYFIAHFAKNVDGANIQNLANAILASKNRKYIKFFLDEVDNTKFNAFEFQFCLLYENLN